MNRYIGIFILTLIVVFLLFFILPMFIWRFTSDIDFVSYLVASLVLLAAFIITQLFYIIDLLKGKK